MPSIGGVSFLGFSATIASVVTSSFSDALMMP
jgi:hypothetical protein